MTPRVWARKQYEASAAAPIRHATRVHNNKLQAEQRLAAHREDVADQAQHLVSFLRPSVHYEVFSRVDWRAATYDQLSTLIDAYLLYAWDDTKINEPPLAAWEWESNRAFVRAFVGYERFEAMLMHLGALEARIKQFYNRWTRQRHAALFILTALGRKVAKVHAQRAAFRARAVTALGSARAPQVKARGPLSLHLPHTSIKLTAPPIA